jgi:hypothetical protein
VKRQSENDSASESDKLARVLQEVTEMRAELEGLKKIQATPDQLNVLPELIRYYLLRLQAITDLADDPAALSSARETIEALTRLNDQLRKLRGTYLKLPS